ncbi:DNA damage-inducible transcript 4 protein isoform X1 [Esox lucius]|uniref:DNA damage-inducible transcript 4 protein n=1 Tax=Esox lucius TaxID=8010 RepID=A0AAY5KVP5_ESOLU|nr:DNA damage-inducible transcript 4 protein isoform X1 [Esox lucius]
MKTMPALPTTMVPDFDCSGSSSSLLDAASRRSSWGKLVQKLNDFSGSYNSSCHSVDTDSDHGSRTDLSETGFDFSLDMPSHVDDTLFYDDLQTMEETLLKEVVELIACSLREAKNSALRCTKLLIPEKLLEHIGKELLHLAASEPCGLRGAVIDLCVEQGETCQSMEQIAVDPYLVPTFQLTLVLRLDSGGLWPKIQGLFTTKSQSLSSPVKRPAIRLSTGFRVIKKKLYSSEDLLIEEC